jgi:hypothetical protein
MLKGYLGHIELFQEVVVIRKKMQPDRVVALDDVRDVSVVDAGLGMAAIHVDSTGEPAPIGSHRRLAMSPDALTFKAARRPEFEKFAIALLDASRARPARPPAVLVHPPTTSPRTPRPPRSTPHELVEPWSPQLTYRAEVAGESHHRAQITRVLARTGTRASYGQELETTAVLVRAPTNRHDPNAVEVHVSGERVGHLARADAAMYAPALDRLAAVSCRLEVPARVWAVLDGDHFQARVTLRLPSPHGIWRSNSLPVVPHVILPSGPAIQVTKEDEHMDALAWHVRESDEVWVAATLQPMEERRPRSLVEVVEVRVDAERVGVLTPAMSAHLLPLIKHIHSSGRPAVARAVIKGNSLKAEVVLHVTKTHEVPRDWLEALGPVPDPGPRLSTSQIDGLSWDKNPSGT